MAEKKVITRTDWVSSFNLIGEAKINDFTFKIDEHSEKSAWVYNSLNLGIDCGEKHGVCYCEMMGGYSDAQPSVIYAHGKHDDGTDDFSQQIQVAWEDRFNEDILESIGELSFISVGLEKTNKGKFEIRRFLSAYDAIAYVKEKLENGMVVNVRGNLKYSLYNDNTQVRKNITSIFLSSKEKNEYSARFTQSVLLSKDSASFKNIDRDKSVMYVDGMVLDYVKEMNGVEIKGQYPFVKQFEYEMDFKDEKKCKLIFEKLFKVKKDITQITFEGEFIEGGATITVTYDDIPDEIKELIECGVYTEEEALTKCSTNGNREQRMLLRRPLIKKVGEAQTPVAQKFENKYTEEDLLFDFKGEDIAEEMPEPEELEVSSVVDDWLNEL